LLAVSAPAIIENRPGRSRVTTINSLNSKSGKCPDAADEWMISQLAHQIEMQRDIGLGHGEKYRSGISFRNSSTATAGADDASRVSRTPSLTVASLRAGFGRLAIALLQNPERAHIQIAQQHVAPVVVTFGATARMSA